VNEHGMFEPAADVSVKRFFDRRARNETIVGAAAVAPPVAVAAVAAVGTSPVCSTTAV
jgi:hypothetical protein